MSDDMREDIEFLYDTIVSLENKKQLEDLFNDLCTYKEILSMAQRLKAAKLLLEGETYGQIIKKTDISSATLSRVSRCVQFGKGYKNLKK